MKLKKEEKKPTILSYFYSETFEKLLLVRYDNDKLALCYFNVTSIVFSGMRRFMRVLEPVPHLVQSKD